MRPLFAALMLAYGVIGMADVAFASVYGPSRVYVPGHIRDGIYIRPHFVSAPKLEYRALPAERGVIQPKSDQPPALDLLLRKQPSKLGEPS
jgi:hypothetical protein